MTPNGNHLRYCLTGGLLLASAGRLPAQSSEEGPLIVSGQPVETRTAHPQPDPPFVISRAAVTRAIDAYLPPIALRETMWEAHAAYEAQIDVLRKQWYDTSESASARDARWLSNALVPRPSREATLFPGMVESEVTTASPEDPRWLMLRESVRRVSMERRKTFLDLRRLNSAFLSAIGESAFDEIDSADTAIGFVSRIIQESLHDGVWSGMNRNSDRPVDAGRWLAREEMLRLARRVTDSVNDFDDDRRFALLELRSELHAIAVAYDAAMDSIARVCFLRVPRVPSPSSASGIGPSPAARRLTSPDRAGRLWTQRQQIAEGAFARVESVLLATGGALDAPFRAELIRIYAGEMSEPLGKPTWGEGMLAWLEHTGCRLSPEVTAALRAEEMLQLLEAARFRRQTMRLIGRCCSYDGTLLPIGAAGRDARCELASLLSDHATRARTKSVEVSHLLPDEHQEAFRKWADERIRASTAIPAACR